MFFKKDFHVEKLEEQVWKRYLLKKINLPSYEIIAHDYRCNYYL